MPLKYFSLLFFACIGGQLCSQDRSANYPLSPVDFTQVDITDSFWKERIRVNREVAIPIVFQRSEESGRINNFKVAAGLEDGVFSTNRGYSRSWRLLYLQYGKWKPIKGKYPIQEDGKPSTINFKPVRTPSLNLDIVLNGKAAELYKWEVRR